MATDLETRLYNLKIGDEMSWTDYAILRVPGGWIFTRFELDENTSTGLMPVMSSVFVPHL